MTLNRIISFLSNNWIAIGSLLISLISLCYSFWKNRKSITVTWDKNILGNYPEVTFVMDSNYQPMTFSHTYTASISIVNSTGIDISYFDLRVFDPKTNINVEFITKRTIPMYIENKNVYQYMDSSYTRYQQLDIPDRKFGIIKGNSFTKMDIIADFDVLNANLFDLNKLTISFKIPKRTLLRDRNAVTNRKRFKYYSKTYDINGWQERWKLMQSELQQRLQQVKKDEEQNKSQQLKR